MRHLKSGRKLKRTSSHRKALMKSLATALFQYKKISTTEAKAKELRPFAERLITKAKHAIAREKQNALPEGQTIDIHSRRVVARYIRSKAVLQELFDTIAPTVENRQGGYTRIIKTGTRRGDAAKTAIIELVDWSAPQDGATSMRRKRPKLKKQTAPAAIKPEAKVAAEPIDEAPVAEVTDVVEVVETQSETQPLEETMQETAEIQEVADGAEIPQEATAEVEAPAAEAVVLTTAEPTVETVEAKETDDAAIEPPAEPESKEETKN